MQLYSSCRLHVSNDNLILLFTIDILLISLFIFINLEVTKQLGLYIVEYLNIFSVCLNTLDFYLLYLLSCIVNIAIYLFCIGT